MSHRIFLKTRWINLINITYKAKPKILEPFLPSGLTLDTIDESAFISLVAFEFRDTKVKGIKIPYHINFPEINLRFYVKSKANRGVVFIKEFVPKFLISFVASKVYNEPYSTAAMKNDVTIKDKISANYTLKKDNTDYFISIIAENKSFIPDDNSIEHFFKEHSYGFGINRSGERLVYNVEHPVWEIFPVIEYSHNLDFKKIYGDNFEFLNNEEPYNVLFAKGSEVKVFYVEKLRELR